MRINVSPIRFSFQRSVSIPKPLGYPFAFGDHDFIQNAPRPSPSSVIPTSCLGLHILSLNPVQTQQDRMRNQDLVTGEGAGRRSPLVPVTNGHLSARHLGKDVALEDLSLLAFKNFRRTLVRLSINIIIIFH